MVKRLQPRLEILPPPQLRLWEELGTVPAPFVLYGGTAIALHLGHRQSEDFDFFAFEAIDTFKVYNDVPFLRNARITQQEPNALTCLVERGGPVKVSFFGLPRLRRLRAPFAAAGHGLPVADLLDLAGTKVSVVQQRAQKKDYVDVDALITAGLDLPLQLTAGRRVFGRAFAPTPTLKALSFFQDGDLAELPSATKIRLMRAVARTDPLSLPALRSTRGKHPL